jgi:hypothetical protein
MNPLQPDYVKALAREVHATCAGEGSTGLCCDLKATEEALTRTLINLCTPAPPNRCAHHVPLVNKAEEFFKLNLAHHPEYGCSRFHNMAAFATWFAALPVEERQGIIHPAQKREEIIICDSCHYSTDTYDSNLVCDRCLSAREYFYFRQRPQVQSTLDYADAVIELLNHIETVVDDENFDKLDPKLWNTVASIKQGGAVQWKLDNCASLLRRIANSKKTDPKMSDTVKSFLHRLDLKGSILRETKDDL